jgi:hypothetical protein
VLVGTCGFVLAFLMSPGESTQNFRWGLCLLTIGLQMALLSRSTSIALRLSEQVSQGIAHVEIEK